MFSGTCTVTKFHTVRAVLAAVLLGLSDPLPAETRLHHLSLNATDPAAAIQFYCARFPCQPNTPPAAPGFTAGNVQILFTQAAEVKPGVTAFCHLGWGAPDIRAEYIRQLDLGTPFAQPLEYLYGEIYFAYVRGPHGVEVEINTAKSNDFSHVHLYSLHPTIAGEWYVRHLGLKATRPLDSKPLTIGRYTVSSAAHLDAGSTRLLIFPRPDGVTDLVPSDGTAVDHLAFTVENLDQKLLDLRRSGARILQMPTAARPRSALVLGPDRMKIKLLEREP